ncbi:hypothetical protein ACRAWG_06080 [Methylobacterium sp. P31]
MMERWLKEIEGTQTKQSRLQHAVAVRDFFQTQPQSRAVSRVDRRVAGEFISDVLLWSGASQNTVNRKVVSLSSMWQWLIKRGFVSDNPWQGQGSFASGSKQGPAKRAYTADELIVLLKAAPVAIMGQPYGTVLFDLMRIGLLTGAASANCATYVPTICLSRSGRSASRTGKRRTPGVSFPSTNWLGRSYSGIGKLI